MKAGLVGKVVDSLAVLVWVLFAGLQLNDPDPLPWTMLYLGAAGLTVARAQGWLHPLVALLSAIFVGLWASALGRQLHQLPLHRLLGEGMMDPEVEVAREAGGLLLVSLWCLALGARGYRERRALPAPPEA